jgi:hypothetical protein
MRQQFGEGLVVDQTHVEIVGAMVNDGLDEQFQVGLVQFRAGSRHETFPLSRVQFEFGVNPQFRAIKAFQRRIGQQVLFDEFVMIGRALKQTVPFLIQKGEYEDGHDGHGVKEHAVSVGLVKDHDCTLFGSRYLLGIKNIVIDLVFGIDVFDFRFKRYFKMFTKLSYNIGKRIIRHFAVDVKGFRRVIILSQIVPELRFEFFVKHEFAVGIGID